MDSDDDIFNLRDFVGVVANNFSFMPIDGYYNVEAQQDMVPYRRHNDDKVVWFPFATDHDAVPKDLRYLLPTQEWRTPLIIGKGVPFPVVGYVHLAMGERVQKIDLGILWVMTNWSALPFPPYETCRPLCGYYHAGEKVRKGGSPTDTQYIKYTMAPLMPLVDTSVAIHFPSVEFGITNADIQCRVDKTRRPLPGELFLCLEVVILNEITGTETLYRCLSPGFYLHDGDHHIDGWCDVTAPETPPIVLVQGRGEVMKPITYYTPSMKRLKIAAPNVGEPPILRLVSYQGLIHWKKGGTLYVFFNSIRFSRHTATFSLEGNWSKPGYHRWENDSLLVFDLFPAFDVVRKYDWKSIPKDGLEAHIRTFLTTEFRHGVRLNFTFGGQTTTLTLDFCMGCAACQDRHTFASTCQSLMMDIIHGTGHAASTQAVVVPPLPPLPSPNCSTLGNQSLMMDIIHGTGHAASTQAVVVPPLPLPLPPPPSPNCSTLTNLGNTCFMNAVLQCLFHCNYFARLIVDFYPVGQHEIFLTFRALLMEAFANIPPRTIHPSDFIYVIRKYFATTYGNGGQHDAHEFLITLLMYFPYPSGLFMLSHMSKLECIQCGYVSVTNEIPTNTISLSFPMEKKKHNLEDLLALYAKHEKLTNDDMWKCPHCMKLVDAIKQLCIYETGPVVIIQLKRFVEGKARRLIKRTDVVLFEESMQFTNGGPMYDLISVIYHKGTLHGGHYAAACRTPSGASWMLYDDAKSKPLATPDFDAAYVLCYALRKFRWSPKYECLMPSSTKIVVNAILVLHKRKDSVLSMLCLNVWKIIFGYLE
jgi:hypothetical protein